MNVNKGTEMYKGYKRPDLTELTEQQRAGEFAQEFYLKNAFDENGKGKAISIEESWKIVEGIPAYIKQQEALFQKEQDHSL